MTAMKTGDLMGNLRKVPSKTVYTAEQQAARAMLAALRRFKAWNDKDQGSGALEDALNAAAKAIAQAEAAGIKAEG